MNPTLRAIRLLAIAAAIFGVVSGVFVAAQDMAGTPKLQALSGRVASVNLFRRMVTVESKGLFSPAQMKTFVVSGETDISDRKGQQELELQALQPGARVKIEYAAEGDRNLARSIILQESAPAPESNAQTPDQPSEAPSRAEPPAEERPQAPAPAP